jgi:hypothetical protein
MAGLVPAISLRKERLRQPKRGHRDKPGDDIEYKAWVFISLTVMAGLVPAISLRDARCSPRQAHSIFLNS